eukprot:1140177-Pelagomonas_calceolata.AAC.1
MLHSCSCTHVHALPVTSLPPLYVALHKHCVPSTNSGLDSHAKHGTIKIAFIPAHSCSFTVSPCAGAVCARQQPERSTCRARSHQGCSRSRNSGERTPHVAATFQARGQLHAVAAPWSAFCSACGWQVSMGSGEAQVSSEAQVSMGSREAQVSSEAQVSRERRGPSVNGN